MKQSVPYGEWESPVTTERITEGVVGLTLVGLDGEWVVWSELRPNQAGRTALLQAKLDGSGREELGGPALNVRTLVHEYGGGAAFARAGVRLAVSFEDQRVWNLPHNPRDPSPARPITPGGARYADFDLGPDLVTIAAIRERGQENALVIFPLDGDGSAEAIVVDAGHDFFASPCFSPDGRELAYLSWDHPDMPWEGSELWRVRIDPSGAAGAPSRVAGGRGESILQPSFSPEGRLSYVSDRSGYWNLYQIDGAEGARALCSGPFEIGRPIWTLGGSSYGYLDPRRIVACATERGVDRLLLIDAERGGILDDDLRIAGCVSIDSVRCAEGRVVLVGAAVDRAAALHVLDLEHEQRTEIARSVSVSLEPEDLSAPESISFASDAGERAHGFYYPPRNRCCEGPAGALPPLIVQCHGGPTASASPALRLAVQFWTSRGFAVVDVNYGGSSGFGRAYRERLDGRWGEVDLADCCAAVRHLTAEGRVDPCRVAIRGGSAGGFTALCAACFSDLFAAAASHYGIADLELIARDTHKLESHYFERLLGPLPEALAVYRARSPIYQVDRIRTPLLLLQGLEDKVVPPSQTERMAAALDARGITHACLTFPGESHGFRRAESIERALLAELQFYAHVFALRRSEPSVTEIKHPRR
jgi:dipeptidyl aminopeptidase/acylaminoacyl peptidase